MRFILRLFEGNLVKGGLYCYDNDEDDDFEKVLVVEVFGVRDNEVFV